MFSQSPLHSAFAVLRLPQPNASSLFLHPSLTHSLSPRSLMCLCCLSFISFLLCKELQRHSLAPLAPLTHRIKTHAPHTQTQSAALPFISKRMHPTKYPQKHHKTHNSMFSFLVPVTNIRRKKKKGKMSDVPHRTNLPVKG